MKLPFADRLLRYGPDNPKHLFVLCEIIITEPDKTVSLPAEFTCEPSLQAKQARIPDQVRGWIPG